MLRLTSCRGGKKRPAYRPRNLLFFIAVWCFEKTHTITESALLWHVTCPPDRVDPCHERPPILSFHGDTGTHSAGRRQIPKEISTSGLTLVTE
jgi:hypothetical protein